MSSEGKTNNIDYVEIPAKGAEDFARIRQFYANVFGWGYKDWGDDYADTESSGVKSGLNADADNNTRSPLVVIHTPDLEAMQDKIRAEGGEITKDIFSFPGGRRFHFRDPSGNELAAWSDT